MDVREVNDLMDHWLEHPPAYVAARQLRDVVIEALGGRAPSRTARGAEQTPDQLAAVLGLTGGSSHVE